MLAASIALRRSLDAERDDSFAAEAGGQADAVRPANRRDRAISNGDGCRHSRHCGRLRRHTRRRARSIRGARDGMLRGKRILLIIGGGIAAYKSLDLIRRLRERGRDGARGDDQGGAGVRDAARRSARSPAARCSPTSSTARTSTMSATSASPARPTSIVVAPATADLIARMAGGHADDLATADPARHRRAGAASRRR